jgi:two-component system NtrC family sensor kinase
MADQSAAATPRTGTEPESPAHLRALAGGGGAGEGEEVLRQLVASLPTAVCVSDPDTRAVRAVNAAFQKLVGFGEGEIVGALPPYPWWAVGPEELPSEETDGGASADGLFRAKEGTLIPVEIRQTLIRAGDGRPLARLAFVTDRSERRQLEQQLLESGKLAAIGQLAAGVAHEINNPLFAILGLVEFLLKDAEPGTKSHERLVLVQQTALEIKEIVRALLDFAREPADVTTTMSVQEVAAQTVDLVRRTIAAKDIEIVERYGEEATIVSGSPNQLKQVFLNLLTNAQQAMPEGGTVTVAVERRGDLVRATVSDTGPGIPEETLALIFEPFYSSKRRAGGSGLGLSISRGIAQMHGGDLTTESRAGAGASFVLALPAVKEGR